MWEFPETEKKRMRLNDRKWGGEWADMGINKVQSVNQADQPVGVEIKMKSGNHNSTRDGVR